MRRSSMSASDAQRDKVRLEELCRECYGAGVDPAHVIPRANGGCDHEDCVIPLCRDHHRKYDADRTLDVLPLLTKAEQAHAVAHVGLVAAMRRLTNDRGAA